MTPEQIVVLENALCLRLPSGFRDVVVDGDPRSGSLSTEHAYFGLRPLLIWNLRHRDELRRPLWGSHYLVVGDDGCGDTYLVDTNDQRAAVHFHDHETNKIEEISRSYRKFVAKHGLVFENKSDPPLAEDTVAITRADNIAESILHPIRASEWLAVIDSDPELFAPTGQWAFNGIAVWGPPDGDDEIHLHWGALEWKRPGLEGIRKARELASRLGAKLLLGWEESRT